MRITQATFGVFHSFDLARELHRRHLLDTIYSTWPWARLQREGLPRARVKSFPWVHTPEFLLRRAGLLPPWLEDPMGYFNALSFDEYTARRIGDCDALIALAGAALKTGRLVQRRGGKFICDRGSSHARYQERVVGEEQRRWGVKTRANDLRDTLREEEIYTVADAITVPSTFARRSFLEEGVPASKVHVIPYGVRLESFKKTVDPDPARFEVLFVGSGILRKGLPYLLQAFAKFQHPAKRLRVIGALPSWSKGVLDRLPQEGVEYLGTLPQHQLPAIMSSSHVLVLPSIEDGFGMVIGQAMACGCPVIGSTNTGAEDILTEGVDGFIVPIRDPEAIAVRLQQLAEDSNLRDTMSEAALQRVRTLGGWNSYGDQWESLLTALIG